MHPRSIVECGSCGDSFDAEMGECPRCLGGVYQGPMYAYNPMWHWEQAGFAVEDDEPERIKIQ